GQGELMTYSRPRPRHRRAGRTANRTVLWSGVVLCRCSCLHGGVVCACGHEYAYPVRPGGDTYYLLPGLLGARGPRAAFCGGGRGGDVRGGWGLEAQARSPSGVEHDVAKAGKARPNACGVGRVEDGVVSAEIGRATWRGKTAGGGRQVE